MDCAQLTAKRLQEPRPAEMCSKRVDTWDDASLMHAARTNKSPKKESPTSPKQENVTAVGLGDEWDTSDTTDVSRDGWYSPISSNKDMTPPGHNYQTRSTATRRQERKRGPSVAADILRVSSPWNPTTCDVRKEPLKIGPCTRRQRKSTGKDARKGQTAAEKTGRNNTNVGTGSPTAGRKIDDHVQSMIRRILDLPSDNFQR